MDNSIFKDYSAEDFEQKFGDGSTNPTSESQSETTNETLLGLSWNELSKREFANADKVMFGLVRGNVGTLIAATGAGKTTLTLNIALTMTAGGTFHPLVKEHHTGRRVMYIDGESTLSELKTDIEKMLRDWSPLERKVVEDNLLILCDEEIDDEPLNLSNPEHRAVIKRTAQEFKPDLIIVDTLSALFTLNNENDNAEMKKVVMQPLKSLAKDVNAAVLMLHHIGKQSEEAQASVNAYRGRGASALGCLSRTVLALTQDKANKDLAVLSCPKVKGKAFEDMILRLDEAARWFVATNEAPKRTLSTYERVVETVRAYGRPVKRKDIEGALPDLSKATIGRSLTNAVEREDLKQHEYGFYCAPEYDESPSSVSYEEASKIM